ncbi:hypothetical protein P7K49_027230 [Saguinus oedipus]|uniref:Uncharacterized protein n=1 Tax=Saguinus oedipus TaxID=9490 RepID=A0ABQ9U8V5_SAGOE|nr:hypothetical protein P7K49_027230 [Saguinus oedipus]
MTGFVSIAHEPESRFSQSKPTMRLPGISLLLSYPVGIFCGKQQQAVQKRPDMAFLPALHGPGIVHVQRRFFVPT